MSGAAEPDAAQQAACQEYAEALAQDEVWADPRQLALTRREFLRKMREVPPSRPEARPASAARPVKPRKPVKPELRSPLKTGLLVVLWLALVAWCLYQSLGR